jgi:predicted CXXCH cytochrome family protein
VAKKLRYNLIMADNKMKAAFMVFVVIVLSCIPFRLHAVVSGNCGYCHTMHNMQDGEDVNDLGPMPNLLKIPEGGLGIDVCVGCHSSASSQTIIDNVPIVYNTSEPTKPLAGGNFYWVTESGDSYGHNVRGISDQDAKLSVAPGSTFLQAGCGESCHTSLTLPDYDNSGDYNNGCEGCHQSVKHHADHPAGLPVPSDAGWYRFLSSPPGHMLTGGGGGVYGIEDPQWEFNATQSTHNTHFGGDSSQTTGPDYFESISTFCAGCHYEFHSPGYIRFGVDNGGGGNPWLRHPTDVVIPDSGEFAAGKVINTAYDPDVPVGKPNLTSFNPSLIEDGDKVICLSCHRAHGSDQPDMLRWNYNSMISGTSEDGAGTGCFKCHTEKDGI